MLRIRGSHQTKGLAESFLQWGADKMEEEERIVLQSRRLFIIKRMHLIDF